MWWARAIFYRSPDHQATILVYLAIGGGTKDNKRSFESLVITDEKSEGAKIFCRTNCDRY